MSDCFVCCQPFNQSTRLLVECMCQYTSCRSCVKQYILSQPTEAHCMNCKVRWTQDFLIEKLDKTFVLKTYRDHRKESLFAIEKTRMPEAQIKLESIRKLRVVEKELEDVNFQISSLKKIRINLEEKIHNMSVELDQSDGNKSTRRDGNTFRCHCPSDGCRGLIDSSWKCGLCDTSICPTCREICKEGMNLPKHECKPEVVESVRLIQKDSRPCPQCAVPIHRTFGCDSMFCVSCHVGFHWVTGKLSEGPIHNPEYFRWRSGLDLNQQRNLDVGVCNDEVRPFHVTEKLVQERNQLHCTLIENLKKKVKEIVENYCAEEDLNTSAPVESKKFKKLVAKKILESLPRWTPALNVENSIVDIVYSTFTDMGVGYIGDMRGFPPVHNMDNLISRLKLEIDVPEELKEYYHRDNKIQELLRVRTHILQETIPNHRSEVKENNLDLRVKYLDQEFTEETFKMELAKRDRKNERNRHLCGVLQLYADLIRDHVRLWLSGTMTYSKMIEENVRMRDYSCDMYKNTMEMYGTSKSTQGFKDAADLFIGKVTRVTERRHHPIRR